MESRVARLLTLAAAAMVIVAAPLCACGRSETRSEPPPAPAASPDAPEKGAEEVDGGYTEIELDDERVERGVAFLDEEVLEGARVVTVTDAYVQVVAGYRMRLLALVGTEGHTRPVEAFVYLPVEGPPELIELVELSDVPAAPQR